MLHFRMNMPFYFMAFYGSIMIVIVLLLRILLKNRLPKLVFPVLWGLVLIRFLVPFSLSSPLSMKVPDISLPEFAFGTEAQSIAEEYAAWDVAVAGDASVETGFTSVATQSPDGLLRNWRFLLPAAYFLGLLVTAGILCYQKYCYSRKLKNRLLIEQNETINAILREMGMGHILVFSNDEIASPLVCGFLSPCIYLPARMNFQDITLLRHILTHEATHIRHRDNWMKAAMLIVLCLNWYNPLVWLMSRCLSSDLETACDAAVLRTYDEDLRKSYAFSLLSMAITGNRPTLLYSAFSKTEVEKRIKGVLNYKKASVLALIFAVLFMMGSTVVFATGGQAPFSSCLIGFCFSSASRWGVRAEITRDISLGNEPQDRAESVIFRILAEDETNDCRILEDQIKTALADEFGVEKDAFRLCFGLCLSDEEIEEEYARWGLILNGDNSLLYQGETVRTYADEILGRYQSQEEGTADITVQRDSLGQITSITALHQGDSAFDRRTREIEQNRWLYTGNAYAETTDVVESAAY